MIDVKIGLLSQGHKKTENIPFWQLGVGQPLPVPLPHKIQNVLSGHGEPA